MVNMNLDIIIPVYNAKETIKRLLYSIAIQRDAFGFHVYLVNDCSDYDYQEEVSFFKEYFDIVSDNTDSNMYSFDIHNNLLKNEAGQYREIRFLSSGCKDLAGICMRFAFIDSMYKDKKPFIILDDPFVNMDTFSINNAHRLIEKLAKKYQILYFTCHNSRTMK